MPMPKEVVDALAQEAIDKELGKSTGRPQQPKRPDRLAATAAMLDSALTTARIALDAFMAEYVAFKKNEPDPAPSEAATNRMREAVRPKTFNQSQESP